MPYAISAALKSFRTRNADLKRLVTKAHRLRIGGRKAPVYRDAMLSSAVLLSFALFEAYVSDVIDAFFKGLENAKVKTEQLPPELRAHHALACRLDEWSDIQDPSKLRDRIWGDKVAGKLVLLDDGVELASLDVSPFLAGIAYPKLDNVKKLLTRLGVAKPLDALRGKGGHAIAQKLVSFHDARAELAHTAQLPSWTEQDYQDRLLELEQFALAFDKVLYSRFTSISSSTAWIR